MAEWSARQTRNLKVPGWSLAAATCWICSRMSRVEILGHTCKQPNGCLLPVLVFNPYVVFKLLFSNHLSGVPLN